MKRASLFALVGAFIAGALHAIAALDGCALHNPVPVDPDYPPEPPFVERVSDAGRG